MTTCSIVSACSQVALLVPDYLDSQEMENLEACGNSAESLIPMVITQTASLLQTEAVSEEERGNISGDRTSLVQRAPLAPTSQKDVHKISGLLVALNKCQ